MTFNAVQLETLRKEYNNLNTVDPCGESYKKLIALLDILPQTALKSLANANIKFVSMLAQRRVL